MSNKNNVILKKPPSQFEERLEKSMDDYLRVHIKELYDRAGAHTGYRTDREIMKAAYDYIVAKYRNVILGLFNDVTRMNDVINEYTAFLLHFKRSAELKAEHEKVAVPALKHVIVRMYRDQNNLLGKFLATVYTRDRLKDAGVEVVMKTEEKKLYDADLHDVDSLIETFYDNGLDYVGVESLISSYNSKLRGVGTKRRLSDDARPSLRDSTNESPSTPPPPPPPPKERTPMEKESSVAQTSAQTAAEAANRRRSDDAIPSHRDSAPPRETTPKEKESGVAQTSPQTAAEAAKRRRSDDAIPSLRDSALPKETTRNEKVSDVAKTPYHTVAAEDEGSGWLYVVGGVAVLATAGVVTYAAMTYYRNKRAKGENVFL